MTARSGGGERMNKISNVNAPKVEPRVNNIDPRRPSQIGLAHYYHPDPLYS